MVGLFLFFFFFFQAEDGIRDVAVTGVQTCALPIFHVGELLTAYARVNFAGRTSMEVGVKIIAENVLAGEKRHTNSCYVTYVALDAKGRPTPVPSIVPETPDEKRRYDRAAKRRASRVMDRRDDTGAGEGKREAGRERTPDAGHGTRKR